MSEETNTQGNNEVIENFPITLNLDLHAVNFILTALGELPSKSGAWNLIMEIKEQGEAQMPAPSETAEVSA